MPFPYVTQSEFEPRIDYSWRDFDNIAGEKEYGEVLTTILETESERVEGPGYTGQRWRDGGSVPHVVKDAVIALAQTSLSQIKERGLARESLGSGASGSGGTYDYRPPKEIRDEVKETLEEAGFVGGPDGAGDLWVVSVN